MAEIRIIGTAHVSQKSVDEGREVVEEFQPDIIAIELDPGRFAALKKEHGRILSIRCDRGRQLHTAPHAVDAFLSPAENRNECRR